jgi:penicillin-binding protein-related factor A (putative recombinase)
MKGKDLEKTILELFKHYEEKDIFCLRIHEHRVASGMVVEKSPFDFLVYHDNIIYGFDTKECSGKTINIKTNMKLHQLEAMLQIDKNGGEGFFLVYFYLTKQLIKYDCKVVLQVMKENSKSLSPDDGEEVKLDFLGVLK